MLAERGGEAYAGQSADLQALADKLSLPFHVQSQWDLGKADVVAQWTMNWQLERECAAISIEADDPHLISPWLGMPCQQGSTVTVECAWTGAPGSSPPALAEVFWWSEGDVSFSPAKSAALQIPVDDTLRTYVFRAPAGALDPDGILLKVLLRLRFDPAAGARGTLRLGHVRIS